MRMGAGMVRVARPTESGSAGVLPAVEATVTSVRTASQASRRAVSGWIGPTPRNSAGAASDRRRVSARSVSALTVTVRWGPLPVHVAVVTAAQLGGGELDQRVGTALRRRPGFSMTHPVAHRIDRGLQQGALLGVELTPQDVHAPIGLVAVEPAALVGVVGIGEHPVGVEAQPGGLGEDAHGPGVERLRRAHQDALERRHLLHADVVGKVGDHGHVAEGGAPGPGAVEGGR